MSPSNKEKLYLAEPENDFKGLTLAECIKGARDLYTRLTDPKTLADEAETKKTAQAFGYMLADLVGSVEDKEEMEIVMQEIDTIINSTHSDCKNCVSPQLCNAGRKDVSTLAVLATQKRLLTIASQRALLEHLSTQPLGNDVIIDGEVVNFPVDKYPN